MIAKLYNCRELITVFALRNVQIKYKQTLLGFLWALFMPVVIVLSGIVVKIVISNISGRPIDNQSIAGVAVKALPWAFFISALKFSVGSLVSNVSIVKKIKFPRVVFPLSYTLSSLFDFILAVGGFLIIFSLLKVGVSIQLFWVPVILIVLIVFTAGWGMILAVGNLFYRDVKYIVDVILTFAIFFTPVFYEPAEMGARLSSLVMINPMASILVQFTKVVVDQVPPDPFWLSYAAVVSMLSFWIGWRIFHATEGSFAEYI